MKFIWFAFTLCFGLLSVTAFVAWQAHREAREARKEVLMFRQQQNDQIAAGAQPLPGPLDSPLAPAPAPAKAPSPGTASTTAAAAPSSGAPTAVITPPGAPAAPTPPPVAGTDAPEPEKEAAMALTAQQSHVLTLPAIARIKEVHLNEGFVLIDAGTARQMEAGMKFDVRRGASLVGRVALTDAMEADEAIADILPMASPIGIALKAGDELVQITPVP